MRRRAAALALCAGLCAGLAGCASAARGSPFPALRVVAPGVVSTPDAVERTGSVAPDGEFLYFTRELDAVDHAAIFRSPRLGDSWGTPERILDSGRYSDRDPFISPDGRTLYFSSDRPHVGKTDRSYDLWYAQLAEDGAWGVPERLPAPVASVALESAPSVTRAGVLYFASGRPGPRPGVNRYRTRRTGGRFVEPELVDSVATEPQGDPQVYVTADGRGMLLFVREGPSLDRRLAVRLWGRTGWGPPRIIERLPAVPGAAPALSPTPAISTSPGVSDGPTISSGSPWTRSDWTGRRSARSVATDGAGDLCAD